MAAEATWKTPNPVIQAMSKMTPSQNNMESFSDALHDRKATNATSVGG